jgi:putative AlgH/UPF0301 family transcriptional regulator
MEVADPRSSRAVLIGAASYSRLGPLPAVARNLDDLRDAFTDPDIWGLPPENCMVIADQPDPPTISRALRAAAGATGPDGLLLVYYAGHGLVQSGDLVLGLPETDPEFPDEGGLPYEKIRQAARTSVARRRVVILDCCYAGRAGGDFLAPGNPAEQLANEADIEETCLLVAVGANRPAAAPLNARNTAFTGALLRVIRDGIAGAGPLLTVREIELEVRRALAAAGHERPELRERNSGGSLPLVRNTHVRRQDLVGAVLLSDRDVTDPELRREAVLVLRHNETGAMGVRLTRPSGSLPEALHGWGDLATHPAQLFDGGPVARDGFIALVLLRPHAEDPLRFTAVRGRLGSLPLTTPLPAVRDSIGDLRVFSGYLGWGPGELEKLLRDAVVRRVDPPLRTPFSINPHDLWPRLQST